MGIKEMFEMKFAINFIKKTDPVLLADRTADIVDHLLDAEMGDKRSEMVQDVAVPWIDKFCIAFNKRLLADQKNKGEKDG